VVINAGLRGGDLIAETRSEQEWLLAASIDPRRPTGFFDTIAFIAYRATSSASVPARRGAGVEAFMTPA
jgi:hypothetical protein